jgi:H+/Cl- antiporter ClcA
MSGQSGWIAASSVLRNTIRWSLLVVPVGILAGSASAFFLWSLDEVTSLRWQQGWLLYLLPVAGAGVAWVYHHWGRNSAAGNNLILEQIHAPGGGVPVRMAPLVLGGTLLTHLCGGSAGREGTAVQMGGSIASLFARWLRMKGEDLQVLLLGGVAAGFGAVFGTPLAGAVFALEVLVIGRFHHRALLPVLVAGLVGDTTCTAWGIAHTRYCISFPSTHGASAAHDIALFGKVALAAIAFGLVSRLFVEIVHLMQGGLRRLTPAAWLQPVVGAAILIALVWLVGTRDYLGLGVQGGPPGSITILSAFTPGGATSLSWAWKLVFTAITIAAGFKGGEVTPLFFIGATLGHALAVLLGAPVDLFAGLGFVAVFAGATNTPIACTIMAVELFGAQHVVLFALACIVAYYCSGHSGIYPAQRLGSCKLRHHRAPGHEPTLGELRRYRREQQKSRRS